VEREFNLSWTTALPRGNGVSQGTWFGTDSAAQFSVEQGLAETLGLRLGDRLSYQVAGETLTAPITSLRKLDWDSMQVNFFVLAPPAALENFPASYITSFHLEPSRAGMTTTLVRAFPNISVIDVGMLLHQLQETLDQVAHAVGLLFGLSWVAGIVVLYAGLQASADERQRELALMRALGARRGQLRRAMASEFFVLGAVSGLLAGCAAAGLAYALGRWVFHLDYLPSPLLPVTGLLVGALGVVLAGLWLTRDALDQPLTAELMSA
jgi:putative ABC transport system permease protein